MQIVSGFLILATTGAMIWLKHKGIAQAERDIARYLLADARGRDARDREYTAAYAELEGVR
jgi:hypothetical protein